MHAQARHTPAPARRPARLRLPGAALVQKCSPGPFASARIFPRSRRGCCSALFSAPATVQRHRAETHKKQEPTAHMCTQWAGGAWDGRRRRGGTGKPGHAPARPGAAPRGRAHSSSCATILAGVWRRRSSLSTRSERVWEDDVFGPKPSQKKQKVVQHDGTPVCTRPTAQTRGKRRLKRKGCRGRGTLNRVLGGAGGSIGGAIGGW